LPALPRLAAQGDVEAMALARRADLAADRLELDALAQSYGLTERTRAISLLEVTGVANRVRTAEGDKASPRGVEAAVEIPIFDFGAARSARAREVYMGAVNRLLESAVNARSEAREAYVTWRARRDIAVAYQARVLPLRKVVTDEALLRYNGMLADPTDLLTEARATVAARVAAIRARREALLAHVDLQAALTGGGASAAAPDSAAGLATPAPAAAH
ncbi:TolC family protein, partial [Methylopila musalis]